MQYPTNYCMLPTTAKLFIYLKVLLLCLPPTLVVLMVRRNP